MRIRRGGLKEFWKKGVTIKSDKLKVVDGALNGKATFDEMIQTS